MIHSHRSFYPMQRMAPCATCHFSSIDNRAIDAYGWHYPEAPFPNASAKQQIPFPSPIHLSLISSHIPRTQPRKSIRTMSSTIRETLEIDALLAHVAEGLRLSCHLLLLLERVHATDGHRSASLWDFALLLLLHCAVLRQGLQGSWGCELRVVV